MVIQKLTAVFFRILKLVICSKEICYMLLIMVTKRLKKVLKLQQVVTQQYKKVGGILIIYCFFIVFRLAIIQLATYTEVFVLDIIALFNNVTNNQLEEFGERLFTSSDCLKLGQYHATLVSSTCIHCVNFHLVLIFFLQSKIASSFTFDSLTFICIYFI